MTPEEWDHWRNDPLTKSAFSFLGGQISSQFGRTADKMAREQYGRLLTSPQEQIYYARLRGHVECVNELNEALKKPMKDLVTEEDEENAESPKNRS